MPDLIIIHRSAFFHAMDLDFQIGYPPFQDSESAPPTEAGQPPSRSYLYNHLYNAALNRLQAFLGYAGLSDRKARFLVYSRGNGREWDEAFRQDWVQNVERRFPVVKGRVFTIDVKGGIEKASFRDPATIAALRRSVVSILGLGASGSAK
jgi:hypothetical protein